MPHDRSETVDRQHDEPDCDDDSASWHVVLLLAALPGVAAAQSPLSASVDRTDLTTDDTVTLSVVVNSQSGATAQPELPPLDGLGRGRAPTCRRQISMVNGAVSASVGYDYQLQPTRAGDLTIGAVTAAIDGTDLRHQSDHPARDAGDGPPVRRPAHAAPVLPPGELGRSDYLPGGERRQSCALCGPAGALHRALLHGRRRAAHASLFGGQPTYGAPGLHRVLEPERHPAAKLPRLGWRPHLQRLRAAHAALPHRSRRGDDRPGAGGRCPTASSSAAARSSPTP